MATPADDYSEQSFFWHEFINELAPLNARTAMQYFEASPWYRIEPPSNNQILRMQNTGVDVNDINEAEQLRALVGIEFALVLDQGPSLFMIQKRRRLSFDQVHALEAYYIINNHIQQAPPLYNLLSTRLNASSHLLMNSMSILKKQMPSFTPTKGHAWPILYDPTMKEGSKKPGGGTTVGGSIDSSAMDIDTPGGPQASSARPGQGHTSSSTNVAGQVSVTVPLLNAIRTTAAHVQRKAASRAQPPDGQKRIIRSAMSIGSAVPPPSPDEVVTSPPTVTGLSGSNVPQLHKLKIEDATTHASVSGAKRVASPQVGVSSQFAGADGGTPVGERARKKKKRTGTKDAQTPVSAGSPAMGPAWS